MKHIHLHRNMIGPNYSVFRAGEPLSIMNMKHGKLEKSKGRRMTSAHYEDPMSPIASTPMKSQSIKKRENVKNTKSKYAKRVKTGAGISSSEKSSHSRSSQISEEDPFYSPRKLVHEYDSEDKLNHKDSSVIVNKEKGDRIEQAVKPLDADAVIFSPAVKVPRANRNSISTSSSASGQSSKACHRRDSSGCVSERSVGSWYDGEPDDNEPSMLAYEDSIVTMDEYDTNVDEQVSEQLEYNPFHIMKHLPKYETIVPHPRTTVLPPISRNTHNTCLVLDLDETLVHCSVDELDNSQLDFEVLFNGNTYNVNVRLRPHMRKFLETVSKNFEVVVFTASQRVYAEKLLNLLDPHRNLIQYRLYREDCLEVDGNYLKDLNVLGRDLSKVVIVDNSPPAFGYQVDNGVPIESWFDDEDDEELVHLIPFLGKLADVDDVRPIIKRQFQIQMLIDNSDLDTI